MTEESPAERRQHHLEAAHKYLSAAEDQVSNLDGKSNGNYRDAVMEIPCYTGLAIAHFLAAGNADREELRENATNLLDLLKKE